MNRRNFLHAATGCAVAMAAAPVVCPVETITGWVTEECLEDSFLRLMNYKTLAVDSHQRTRFISFQVRRTTT